MPPITPADGPVAVTGASGFLGSHVVKVLVEAGYAVRACVRDATDEVRTAPLRAMGPAVECFSCDLLTPGGYDEAFAGVCAIFHVAAVLGNSGKDATPKMTYDGGVVGTTNVLSAVKKAGSVKRVVYTSSVSAIWHGGKSDGDAFTEADWANEGDPENWSVETQAYAKSKVDSEHMLNAAAAASLSSPPTFTNRLGWDAITCCPAMILGPLLSTAHHAIWQERLGTMLSGEGIGPNSFWNIVDVRDLAMSQLLMAESDAVSTPSDRYQVAAAGPSGQQPGVLTVVELAGRMKKLYPQFAPWAPKVDGGRPPPNGVNGDCSKIAELGLVSTPLDDTLRATADTLLSLKLIEPALATTAAL